MSELSDSELAEKLRTFAQALAGDPGLLVLAEAALLCRQAADRLEELQNEFRDFAARCEP